MATRRSRSPTGDTGISTPSGRARPIAAISTRGRCAGRVSSLSSVGSSSWVPNASGIEWELHYESRAPMWELLPITIRKTGRTIVDMTHIKQPARYTGWVSVDGERISVDGFHGGRDRTFGIRASRGGRLLALVRGRVRGPRDRGVGVGVVRRHGPVRRRRDHVRGRHAVQAVRRVRARRDVRRRRQASGARRDRLHRRGRSDVPRRPPIRRIPTSACSTARASRDVSRARRSSFSAWNSTDTADLAEVESGALAIDQLMRYEMDGMTGSGIFELLVRGDHYQRYPTWG